MRRDSDEDVKLRSMLNELITAYNETSLDVLDRHALGVDTHAFKQKMGYVWEEFFANDQAYEGDEDVVNVLMSFPYRYWPEGVFLQASMRWAQQTGRPIIGQAETTRLDDESRFLLEYLGDVNSQTGEDGIIRKIFDIIGAQSSWCVEFGAWDGKRYSNTYGLINDENWNGVLIEAAEDRFKELAANYDGNDRANLFNTLIGFDPNRDSIDYILGQTDIPKDPDLMIIDIDGNDWHVWNSMQAYRPRVMVVEMNPTIPNDVLYVQERDPAIQRGCSLRALIELGKAKGYELVSATSLNGFFVVAEEFEKFGIKDNSIDAMYTPVLDGRIFHGYDASIHVIGMERMLWNWAGNSRVWAGDMPDRITVY